MLIAFTSIPAWLLSALQMLGWLCLVFSLWVGLYGLNWVWKYLRAFIIYLQLRRDLRWGQIRRALIRPSPLTFSAQLDGKRGNLQRFLHYKLRGFPYRRIMLLGPSGSGKTSALIQFKARSMFLVRRRPYRIHLLDLHQPDCLDRLVAIRHPEKSILCLYGNHEAERDESYLDRVFKAAQGFPYLIWAVDPIHLSKVPHGPGIREFKFVGVSQFELFAVLQILPLSGGEAKKWLRQIQAGKAFGPWAEAQGKSFRNPFLLRVAAGMTQVPDAHLFPFQLLDEAWENRLKRWDSQTLAEAYTYCLAIARHSLTGAAYPDGKTPYACRGWPYLLEHGPDGQKRFVHPAWAAYFLARDLFQQGMTEPVLSTDQVQAWYRQMCTEVFMKAHSSGRERFRRIDQADLRSWDSLRADDLAHISRLYMQLPGPGTDLRLLSHLHTLRGLYLDEAQRSNLSQDLLSALPHQQVSLYLTSGDFIREVYAFRDTQADLTFQDQSKVRISAKSLARIELPARFSILEKRPAAPNDIAATRFWRLFDQDYRDLKAYAWRRGKDEPDLQQAWIERWELHLGQSAWELFDRIALYLWDDGTCHMAFRCTHRPTLLTQSLDRAVERLLRLYGPDDGAIGLCTPDDHAQMEEGYWPGRLWSDMSGMQYAHPIYLYQTGPHELQMQVFGIQAFSVPVGSKMPDPAE